MLIARKKNFHFHYLTANTFLLLQLLLNTLNVTIRVIRMDLTTNLTKRTNHMIGFACDDIKMSLMLTKRLF